MLHAKTSAFADVVAAAVTTFFAAAPAFAAAGATSYHHLCTLSFPTEEWRQGCWLANPPSPLSPILYDCCVNIIFFVIAVVCHCSCLR